MPGNFSTAINVENFGAISWPLLIQGPLSRRIDRWMLKQDQCIWALVGCDLAMNCPLNCQRLFILDQATSLKGKRGRV
jgi:hypothetical protein